MRNIFKLLYFTVISFAMPASAQSLIDLTKLSDAVWLVSNSQADDIQILENVVSGIFPAATFEEVALQADWAEDAIQYSAHFPDYSRGDSIECAVLHNDGISRFSTIVKRYGNDARDYLPSPLHPFLMGALSETSIEGALSLQFCLGAFHPSGDRVDFAAWDQWYDLLEIKFQEIGMDVVRSESAPPAYLAGFLSATGNGCDMKSCVIAAGPFNTALPSLNTNQATFATISIIWP